MLRMTILLELAQCVDAENAVILSAVKDLSSSSKYPLS
ncbi:MAG: hypothetical protein JWQ58_1610 [Reyranella sp.]|nr:hypothetical protein [Reyranella sp.]